MEVVMVWLGSNWPILMPLVWALVNEFMAHNPKIASNSVVQLLLALLRSRLPGAK